jgi:hypothetical protein
VRFKVRGSGFRVRVRCNPRAIAWPTSFHLVPSQRRKPIATVIDLLRTVPLPRRAISVVNDGSRWDAGGARRDRRALRRVDQRRENRGKGRTIRAAWRARAIGSAIQDADLELDPSQRPGRAWPDADVVRLALSDRVGAASASRWPAIEC